MGHRLICRTWKGTKLSGVLPLVLLLWAACGKIGDPLPPRLVLPPSIQTLTATRVGDRNQVEFSIPTQQLEWVEIFRQCSPVTTGDRINLVARIGLDEMQAGSQPGRFVWLDPDRQVNCRYAVKFVDPTGLRSEFSNFATAP